MNFAGTTRLAARSGTGGTLRFLLSDHLGSSSVTTDANGVKTASALYREASRRDKAFGETRYTLGTLNTDYKFTGQREEASLGIYFFQARWYDGSLGRFLSPDSIVPTSTQGTQAWDRYAFVNNNPVRYNDPTGHRCVAADGEDEDCLSGDDTTGSGFTGVSSASHGRSSNTAKGCGGVGQPTCTGETQKPPELTSPNPSIWALIPIAILIHIATMITEAGVVIGEAALIPADAAIPPVAIPLGLLLAAVGLTVLDIDNAFIVYTARVAMYPDVHQEFKFLPPWGLFE